MSTCNPKVCVLCVFPISICIMYIFYVCIREVWGLYMYNPMCIFYVYCVYGLCVSVFMYISEFIFYTSLCNICNVFYVYFIFMSVMICTFSICMICILCFLYANYICSLPLYYIYVCTYIYTFVKFYIYYVHFSVYFVFVHFMCWNIMCMFMCMCL